MIPNRSSVRRRRSRNPRALDRVPPREGAARARPRLRLGHRRARQGASGRRRVGHRVRRRPQQLLPAGDERADAGVRRGLGVRPRGVCVQRGRLHRARGVGAGSRPGRDVLASGADRLPLRADRRRGRGRRAHEGALPRLARAGRHASACTSTRAASPSTWTRSRACTGSAARKASGALRSRGARASRTGRTGRSPPSRPPRGGSRSASRSWSRRARGRSSSGRCSGCRRRSTCTRPQATSSATVRCGRTGTSRRARSASTRFCSRPPTAARRR